MTTPATKQEVATLEAHGWTRLDLHDLIATIYGDTHEYKLQPVPPSRDDVSAAEVAAALGTLPEGCTLQAEVGSYMGPNEPHRITYSATKNEATLL